MTVNFSFASQVPVLRNVNSITVFPLTFCLSCLDTFKDFGAGKVFLAFPEVLSV